MHIRVVPIVKISSPIRLDLSPPAPRCCRTNKAQTDDVITRSAPSMTSPASAVAAAYHGVRAVRPLDVLPGRNPIVIWYCCKQPTSAPRPFLPRLPAVGSTRILCCAPLLHQTTPLGGRTRLATVRRLAKCADYSKYFASTTNLLKWTAYGKKNGKKCRATSNPPLATHDRGASLYAWLYLRRTRRACTCCGNPRWPLYTMGVSYATTMDISCCYSLPTVMIHRRA